MRPFFGALLSRYWTTMKLLKFAPLAIAGALSSVAHAQSSVTLYGLISAGVGYATNQGGKNAWQALSGTNQNPRWGLKGIEERPKRPATDQRQPPQQGKAKNSSPRKPNPPKANQINQAPRRQKKPQTATSLPPPITDITKSKKALTLAGGRCREG